MAEHPITPPPELVREWAQINGEKDLERFWMRLATQATRWGADQELEACCAWLSNHNWRSVEPALRAARRPKPPSLKEEALEALELVDSWGVANMSNFSIHDDLKAGVNTIRRALEALPE